MELWIRSQNKKELIPNPKLGIDQCENRYYIVDRYNFENAFILGEYKSKERALEILDEIQEFIEDKEKSNIEITSDGINQSITYPKIVYEMPKE